MSSRAVLVGVGAILVMALAFYFLAYRPLDAQQTALQDETETLVAQQQQLRNQVNQLEQIRDDELSIRADLNRLRALIPSGTPGQPALVHQLQLAADASGVSIQSLNFGIPSTDQAAQAAGVTTGAEGLVLASIPVNGELEGGYFQVVDLLRRIEVELTRGVLLDTVAMTEGEDGFPTLNVAFTARVFALLPQVQAAAPTPPAGGQDGDTATPSPSPSPTGAEQ